jgi:hypothetical protein
VLRVLYRLLSSKIVTTALTVLLLGTLEVDGEKARDFGLFHIYI